MGETVFNTMELIRALSGKCACGVYHETSIRDIRVGSGLVHQVGDILRENGFPQKLLLVADRNTLRAAEGIVESLTGFQLIYHIYDDIRVAQMEHVTELEAIIGQEQMGVLSVGTGSVNDPCRLAAARKDMPLCIFATAPSMDGFASYSSPILEDGFKLSFPAKSPEVIIGDTRILASAPRELKSAGFGDMIAKYTALIDWQVSSLLTGELYCEKVAKLTRDAVDELFALADKVTENDEYTAGLIFESLLKTGIGMSFTQNSRPASGAEHIISHLIECKQLLEGIIPNFHGDDIGVCTLELLKLYNRMAELPEITTKQEQVDWDEVYAYYGPMAEAVKKVNHPENIVDAVDPEKLRTAWPQIREIIAGVPSYQECKAAMEKAGCKITVADIGKPQELFDGCMRYSPFMRKRLTLLRLYTMINEMQLTEKENV